MALEFISSYATLIAQDLISPVGGWNFYDLKDLKKLDLNTLLKIDGPAKSSMANMIAGKVRDRQITELNAIRRARQERLKRLQAQKELEDERAAKKAKQEHMQSEASAQARDELMAQVAETAQKDSSLLDKLLEEKHKVETRYDETEQKIEELADKKEKLVEIAHEELHQVFETKSKELLAMAEESLQKNPDQPELKEAKKAFSDAIDQGREVKKNLAQVIESLKNLKDPEAPLPSTLRHRDNLVQELKMTHALKTFEQHKLITKEAAAKIRSEYKAEVIKQHQIINSINKALDGAFAERKELTQQLKTINEAIQKTEGGNSYTLPPTTKGPYAPEKLGIEPRETGPLSITPRLGSPAA